MECNEDQGYSLTDNGECVSGEQEITENYFILFICITVISVIIIIILSVVIIKIKRSLPGRMNELHFSESNKNIKSSSTDMRFPDSAMKEVG